MKNVIPLPSQKQEENDLEKFALFCQRSLPEVCRDAPAGAMLRRVDLHVGGATAQPKRLR
jgi:hypothetical protein